MLLKDYALNLCIFSAQLKFIPLPSIFENCKKYIGEGQLLTIPVNIRVADQVGLVDKFAETFSGNYKNFLFKSTVNLKLRFI